MASPKYKVTSTNKLGRLANRGTYSYSTVHTLVNACPILHVSFVDPEQPFPVVLPMLGCTGNFEDQDADPNTSAQDLYIHGYVSGRMFRKSKESEAGGEEGLAVSVAASFLDGLVLALAPFHNSCNYRSATVFGYASLVTDQSEALYAMRLITNNLLPNRWEDSRSPPTQAELSSTSILKIRIVSAAAKVREGGPSEDRDDLKNEALVKNTWTGVVPYWGQWGEMVRGEECGRKDDGSIQKWIQEENSKAEKEAYAAIGDEGKLVLVASKQKKDPVALLGMGVGVVVVLVA